MFYLSDAAANNEKALYVKQLISPFLNKMSPVWKHNSRDRIIDAQAVKILHYNVEIKRVIIQTDDVIFLLGFLLSVQHSIS